MNTHSPVTLITPGEPAGIGPELVCQLALEQAAHWVAVADPHLLQSRADGLGLAVEVVAIEHPSQAPTPRLGALPCWPVSLAKPCVAGRLDVANAPYVIECLSKAAGLCGSNNDHALITGPIHKAIINEAGLPFTGHTEYLRDQAKVDQVVMMLSCVMHSANDWPLRVALATTHLPLAEVPSAITSACLARTIEITHQALVERFGIQDPRIMVLGLNPHAGEGGHLGQEEIQTIGPVIEAMKAKGMNLIGPVPADTAFVPDRLVKTDAVLAMYHDQGLPVLKHVGFGDAVNITLGLPYIRTSVDHGTALDIAGKGQADLGSLQAAVAMAKSMQQRLCIADS